MNYYLARVSRCIIWCSTNFLWQTNQHFIIYYNLLSLAWWNLTKRLTYKYWVITYNHYSQSKHTCIRNSCFCEIIIKAPKHSERTYPFPAHFMLFCILSHYVWVSRSRQLTYDFHVHKTTKSNITVSNIKSSLIQKATDDVSNTIIMAHR